MAEDNMTVPAMDHDTSDAYNGQSEAELLDAVMANSMLAEAVGIVDEPLPEEEYDEDDPSEETGEEDPEEVSEDVTDEDDESEVDEDAEEGDEESNPDVDVYRADDLDDDTLFEAVVDGEKVQVPFAELVKNYQTNASISNKGRELGEARKAFEEEKSQAIAEIAKVGEASTAILMKQENGFAQKYHEAKKELDGLSKDDYDYREVKDKVEELQGQYWAARNEREGIQKQLEEHKQQVEQKQWNEKLEYFNTKIDEYIPDFNEDVANEIREFVLGEGLDEEFLAQIVHPSAVKLMNDYRLLSESVKKGSAKRKTAPAKKAVPVKKAKSSSQKNQDKAKMTKARAFREDASKADQDAFLRQIAENSLSKL